MKRSRMLSLAGMLMLSAVLCATSSCCSPQPKPDPLADPWTGGVVGKTNGLWQVDDAFMLRVYELKLRLEDCEGKTR